jgi:hypothetical protein
MLNSHVRGYRRNEYQVFAASIIALFQRIDEKRSATALQQLYMKQINVKIALAKWDGSEFHAA